MNINNVKSILEQNNVSVKKQYGQNFLLDENIIRNIVDKANVDKDTSVIEIGPGLGFLTDELSKRANKVLCYEIDKDMVKVLLNKFDENSNVIIKYQDFLKTNIDYDIERILGTGRVVVVANLPYYITTAILLKILEESKYIKEVTAMMQKEVAARLCGEPSTKDYNSLSVLVQYFTNAEMVLKVPPTSFYPEPNVDSSVIKLTYKEELSPTIENIEFFKKFNRALFAQRRKTMVNNLKSFGFKREDIEKVLIDNNYSLTIRSEALKVDEIATLSNQFYIIKTGGVK